MSTCLVFTSLTCVLLYTYDVDNKLVRNRNNLLCVIPIFADILLEVRDPFPVHASVPVLPQNLGFLDRPKYRPHGNTSIKGDLITILGSGENVLNEGLRIT